MQIKTYKDNILFKVAESIKSNEFGPELDRQMSQMAEILFEKNGVGLAGNQVGISKRILIAELSHVNGKKYGSEFIKIVNPEILELSRAETLAVEGCLSYPELESKVSRSKKITLKYFDPYGKEYIRDFENWEARILLHEIDHLNGITLYSRASYLVKNRYDLKMKKLK